MLVDVQISRSHFITMQNFLKIRLFQGSMIYNITAEKGAPKGAHFKVL